MIRDEDEELAVFHKDITYLNALLSKQSLQPRPMRHYLESYPNLPTAVKMEVAGLVDLAFSLLSTQQVILIINIVQFCRRTATFAKTMKRESNGPVKRLAKCNKKMYQQTLTFAFSLLGSPVKVGHAEGI